MRAQGVELLLVGWTGGSPEDSSSSVCEQDDYAAFARNPQLPAELIFIEIEGYDAGPKLRVCEVAAHGRIVPPAIEGIFFFRDGQEVIVEAVLQATEGLNCCYPAVDFGGVSGIEGYEQQVAVGAECGRQGDFGLGEAVGGDGGKVYGRWGLLRCDGNQRERQEQGAEDELGSTQSCPLRLRLVTES